MYSNASGFTGGYSDLSRILWIGLLLIENPERV
jgi:hypothetical protein